MEKILHERLRAMADGIDCEEPRRELGYEVDDEHGKRECAWCSKGALEAIADEIERYYIPRPRFEDGEPVQFGDETDNLESVNIIEFRQDGTFQLGEKRESGWGTYIGIYEAGELVKCPTPKVCDEDGVEIKVAETVWFANSGTERIVKSLRQHDDGGYEIEFTNGLYCSSPDQLTHERPVFDANRERIFNGDEGWCTTNGAPCKVVGDDKRSGNLYVEWTDSEYINSWIKADYFTHREPDSLERIKADRELNICEYNAKYTDAVSIGMDDHLLNRAIALIERGA